MHHWLRWLHRAALLAAVAGGPAAQAQPLPTVASGRIERLANLASAFVAPRHVDVWLPEGYDTAARAGQRFKVLYMQDGQMLFDPASTWNHQAWQVDATLARLLREGRIANTLVVGIWNLPDQRYAEYYPEKFLALAAEPARAEYVAQAQHGQPRADAYLRFLVEELKPAIDRRYATHPGPEGTVVMGASMGGLISVYALCEYPQVFGGAAGLSTHWIGRPTAWGLARARNAALPLAALRYLSQHLPAPASHRLYTDRGTDALDSLYAPTQALVEELLRDRGYTAANATTREVDGAGHNERDWAARLEAPLVFLLAPR